MQTVEQNQLEVVADLFRAFNSATRDLQASYEALSGEVIDLTQELADARSRLSTSRVAEERLRHSLENVLQEIQKGVVLVDPDQRVSLFNPAAELLTGYSRDEAIGQPVHELLGPVTDLRATVPKIPTTGTRSGKLRTKSGEWREVEISPSPIRDADNQAQGFVFLIEDLAEKRRAHEVREREKTFSALGEMSVTIAHEIRNPLGAIELFATLLADDLKGDPKREDLASSIVQGVHSLNSIVSNLLFFTRPMTTVFTTVDLHQVLDEALTFASHAIRQRQIVMAKAYTPGPLVIQGDREQLKQVFLNLFLNAVQAMEDGGRFVIRTRRQAGTAQVSLSDTGPGIPKEVLSKIFDPFFTTKPKGTGLGLAIVQRVLDQHGASIRVRSELKKGTTFILSFGACRFSERGSAQ